MKRFRSLLAMILTISLIASILTITAAEDEPEEVWQADIRALMDPALLPQTTTIDYTYEIPEETEIQKHDVKFEKINANDVAVCIEFAMMYRGGTLNDSNWQVVEKWLDEMIMTALQSEELDSETLARAIAKSIDDARRLEVKEAKREKTEIAIWADANLLITQIEVTTPYFPELSVGINGSATKLLQEKLIALGFLTDKADGYYGNKTKAAVEELEAYIRELEQDVIDVRSMLASTTEPTSAPTAVPAKGHPLMLELILPTASPESDAESLESTTELTPTFTPVTPIDGIADGMLQAYLYSNDYVITRSELSSGDSGTGVLRLQRRLHSLGYLYETPDSHYGDDTTSAMRYFQYYNGLEQTGVADMDTQKVLFSNAAIAAEHPILKQSASGSAVRDLQLRLKVLGFMNGAVDGDYGARTTAGVETLQQYLRDLEERDNEMQMNISDEFDGVIESSPNMEVTGIADPITLASFYADEFPEIPNQMARGSKGIDVVRLQRRLKSLGYYSGELDGVYGNGTEKALKLFQKTHKLDRTGNADTKTMQTLFNEKAKPSPHKYILKISIADQRVYAYGLDENAEYTVLVRTMKCSTGLDETPTPKGTYSSGTGPGAAWHYFKKYECWAQYAYYVVGDIMMHSVLYSEKGGTPTQSSVNNLGRKASHGCIRLSVADAKWVWENCPKDTEIIIY